jgi:hypothetical protein
MGRLGLSLRQLFRVREPGAMGYRLNYSAVERGRCRRVSDVVVPKPSDRRPVIIQSEGAMT